MQVSEQDKVDLVKLLYTDPASALPIFFPKTYTRKWDPVHYDIMNAYFGTMPRVVRAAPRGIGKTSLLLGCYAADILTQTALYIVMVSATSTFAVGQVRNLVYMLKESELVKAIFGDVTDSTYQSQDFYTIKVGNVEAALLPRGAGQQVRGLLFQNRRPDRVGCDDLETRDNTGTPDQREKLKSWFYSDLMGVRRMGSDDGTKFLVLGTLLHPDALLQHLLTSDKWNAKKHKLFDEDFKSLAPNAMSDKDVKDLVELYEASGQMNDLYTEYQNEATLKVDQLWADYTFSYYEQNDLSNTGSRMLNLVIVDPAKTSSTASADTGFVGLSVDMDNFRIYVREAHGGKYNPEETIAETLALAYRIKAQVVAVEKTGLDDYVMFPYKTAIAKLPINSRPMLIPLTAKAGQQEKGKIERIRQLYSPYRSGYILHNPSLKDGTLENQLRAFPKSTLKDVADALSHINSILSDVSLFHTPFEEIDYADTVTDNYFDGEPLTINLI